MQSPMMVIGSIASAPLVLTGSLHGAIIADDPPPPSPEALARFGRPKPGSLNRPAEIGEEQAFDHFMQCINVASSRQHRGAGALARGLLARVGERLDGVTPERTAAALKSLAMIAPQLSPSGIVEERRASLLDRLDELRNAHAAGDSAAA